MLRSAVARESPDADASSLRRGLSEFGLAVYRAALAADPEQVNFAVSPVSVHTTMAMAYAGARERTAEQMRTVLGLPGEPEQAHRLMNALDRALAERARDGVELVVANALWAQDGLPVVDEYLDVLARHYGAGVRIADFSGDPAGSTRRINGWVSEVTRERIPEILAPDSIDDETVAVLTNAVYFKGTWAERFDKARTAPGPFTLGDGTTVDVDFMQQSADHNVASGSGWRAVDLAYTGDELSMLVIVPDDFETFERELDAGLLASIVDSLRQSRVDLRLPSFEFTADADLTQPLQDLGMTDAFDRELADFGGLVDLERVFGNAFIQWVLHKVFVLVDEEGTEAAGSTAAGIALDSAPAAFRVDRPFLFVLRDRPTGAPLFLGRVLDPRAS